MKSLLFDAGPIISLSTNNLLWMLEPLKREFRGSFCITGAVKSELVDRPLTIRQYKFEAIQVQKLIDEGILEVVDSSMTTQQAARLLGIANRIFKAYDNCISIVQYGEISVIAAAISLNSEAIVIDEKMTRLLIENPKMVAEILKKTLHTSISMDYSSLKEFGKIAGGIRTIRSTELAAIAYEKGFLNDYITNIPNPRRTLLESILWGLKLHGCAVSQEEIDEILRIERI
ncbi:hypothetical protein HYX09_03325 [Candidatus Woesearchaeota archaeon]|nr:hypothetical protein [Candidatus Woesearchaeota archaeon]